MRLRENCRTNSQRSGLFELASPIVTDMVLQILLGDGIVCWRACVVWKRNRVFAGTCIALCLITFGESPSIFLLERYDAQLFLQASARRTPTMPALAPHLKVYGYRIQTLELETCTKDLHTVLPPQCCLCVRICVRQWL